MKLPTFGSVRRLGRSLGKVQAGSVSGESGIGLEPLEPRVLLSAVTYGVLPSLNDRVVAGGEENQFNAPVVESVVNAPRASGKVYNDVDGDGLWDPSEHALYRVKVFADLNGDGVSAGEPSTTTSRYGEYYLNNLPAGDYDVRVEMPEGYKAARRGSDSTVVTITANSGVDGTTMALVRAGFDLELAYSDLSISDYFITGTSVKVPVILTNTGNTTMQAGDLKLRVSVSEDNQVSKEDIRLLTAPLAQKLAPGKSVKIDLNVALPSALFNFQSYLIVEAVGKVLRADIDRADNQVVSTERLRFQRSDQQTSLTQSQYKDAAYSWKQTVPYGGYLPAYGFSGGSSGGWGVSLSLWGDNGSPPQPPQLVSPPSAPHVGTVRIGGQHLLQGIRTRITAEDVYDPDGGKIERVMFYYDSDGDNQVDELLGVDSDGSNGYSILANLRPINSLAGEGGRILAVAEDDQGDMGGNVTAASPRLGVNINASKKLVFRDQRGSVVTVSMVGRGRARVLLGGEGTRAYYLGGVIEIAGDAELSDIRLVGTSRKSKLVIDVADKRKTVMTGRLIGNRPLGELSATQVYIRGGIQMTGRGAIQSIKALSLEGGVEMPGEQFTNGVTISVGRLKHDVVLGSPLRQLDVANMIKVRLTTPYAERILVKKNYTTGRLTFTDANADLSLGLLQVGNELSRVQVRAAASIDTIRVKSMIQSGVQVGGSAWLASPASSASQTVRGGMIKSLVVDGGVFEDSFVSAWRIGSVSLDDAKQDSPTSTYGLMYHRLGRYNGPRGLDRTVI